MVFVTMVAFVLLGLISMMVIQRRLQDCVNILRQENRQAALADGKQMAMAKALSVLQTGLPSMTPATYNLRLADLAGQPTYTVVFEEIVGTPVCGGLHPSWKVTVKDVDGSNPDLPDSF